MSQRINKVIYDYIYERNGEIEWVYINTKYDCKLMEISVSSLRNKLIELYDDGYLEKRIVKGKRVEYRIVRRWLI